MSPEKVNRLATWQKRSAIAVLLLSSLPKIAFGMGADHPNDQPVGGSDKWPPGLKDLVNCPERVHGFFVNWQDYFFFAGDSEKLEKFLKAYEKLPGTNRKIILHPGKADVRSPWDKQARDATADWKLYTTPFTIAELDAASAKKEKLEPATFTTELEIWTGGQLELPRLFVIIPPGIPVEAGEDAKEDAKIGKLVARHRQKRPENSKPQTGVDER